MAEIAGSEKRQGLHLGSFRSTALESKKNSPARPAKMPVKCESQASSSCIRSSPPPDRGSAQPRCGPSQVVRRDIRQASPDDVCFSIVRPPFRSSGRANLITAIDGSEQMPSITPATTVHASIAFFTHAGIGIVRTRPCFLTNPRCTGDCRAAARACRWRRKSVPKWRHQGYSSIVSFSLLTGWLAAERPGAVKGAPLWGAAMRTLDGEDRSETIAEEGKLGESLAKSGRENWYTRTPPPTAAR
jgi:hypothetical protein